MDLMHLKTPQMERMPKMTKTKHYDYFEKPTRRGKHKSKAVNLTNIYSQTLQRQPQSIIADQQANLIIVSLSTFTRYSNILEGVQCWVPKAHRHILLDWLIGLCEKCENLKDQTYQMIQMLLDLVLMLDNGQEIKEDSLQLCGLAAFSLVTKYIDRELHIEQLLNQVSGVYTLDQLIQVEHYILSLINYDLSSLVTPFEVLAMVRDSLETVYHRSYALAMYISELTDLFQHPNEQIRSGMFMHSIRKIQVTLYFVIQVKTSGNIPFQELQQIMSMHPTSESSLILGGKEISSMLDSLKTDSRFKKHNNILHKFNKERFDFIARNNL